eukprot:CAMPEP_0195031604 /NCGR_PEP_ID=MMETSP0326_2-20130528/61596_1 /TAXON_ID=2866 ORGANISM="Crypthecodinium cohnii, Strain Seligo" /NCGR_SAMPLE_ID=MMETSP0326_2 /ASSEMBLY_ACC=CAM_ASM_000348 /LENGTH=117 /DNA_ID=CAMNT_0040055389 /DNA_START=195 /DNA_END=546 /DNA_ORIENTATION=-
MLRESSKTVAGDLHMNKSSWNHPVGLGVEETEEGPLPGSSVENMKAIAEDPSNKKTPFILVFISKTGAGGGGADEAWYGDRPTPKPGSPVVVFHRWGSKRKSPAESTKPPRSAIGLD